MYFKTKDIIIEKKLVAKIFLYQKKKFSGIKFFTNDNLPFQVGLMSHPFKHEIISHRHVEHKKIIKNMSEFLIIFKGKLKVFFYNKKKKPIKTVVLNKKDMILLLSGAHGFKVLQKVEMLEIKQGPFYGDKYKIRLNKKN